MQINVFMPEIEELNMEILLNKKTTTNVRCISDITR